MCYLSIHTIWGSQCILDMMHHSPGICLPCLAGHLTRLCCHGNSSVTCPGWAWGMSCGVMARFFQQRQRGGESGRWETSKARQRWLMESWEVFDMEEEEQGVFTASLLQGMLSLCLADLKLAIPSICAESRLCLVYSSSLYRILQ